MNKKKKMEQEPEFRYIRDHFDHMMNDMEKDKAQCNVEMPEEWEDDFLKVIRETLAKKERRERIVRRVGTVAAVAFLVIGGIWRSPEIVHGDGILEVLKEAFEFYEQNYITFGTNKELDVLSEVEQSEVFFDVTSLEMTYEQIRQELLRPMFYVPEFPKRFKLSEAKYDRSYSILNMKLENKEERIYISQKTVLDENPTGLITDEHECAIVKNSNLNQEIPIYQSEQDNNLIFFIQEKNMLISFRGPVTVEECKKIIENIYFE